MSSEEFDEVRRLSDPLVQARRATELLAVYQQRSTELARLRKVAIERAAAQTGLTLAAVAARIGLSKGRVTQIRQGAPAAERALFGVGPVTVAIPTRAVPGRDLPVISEEDSIAAERMTSLLHSYGFAVEQYRIPVGGDWTPHGDVVAICGPKSSYVTAEALEADPFLEFDQDAAGRFAITDRRTATLYVSGMDEPERQSTDTAYIGRLPFRGGTLLVVAGIHAIGSVGAVEYLTRETPDIYRTVGDGCWSAVVRSVHEATAITAAEAVVPPSPH